LAGLRGDPAGDGKELGQIIDRPAQPATASARGAIANTGCCEPIRPALGVAQRSAGVA
jgi:hypothetical protein